MVEQKLRAREGNLQPSSWKSKPVASSRRAHPCFPLPSAGLPCLPLSWAHSSFSEAASRDGKGTSGTSLYPGHLLQGGQWNFTGLLASFPYQSVFQNIQKNSGVFLSSYLQEAIKNTGNTGDPLSPNDWGGGMCVMHSPSMLRRGRCSGVGRQERREL